MSLRASLVLVSNVLFAVALAVAAGAQPVQQEQVESTFSGKVVAIDGKAGSFSVRSVEDETVVFHADADTTIMSGSQKVPLSGLHQGEWVAVDSDHKGGQRRATYVEVVDDPGMGKGMGKQEAAPEPTAAGTRVEVGHNRLSPSMVTIGAGQSVTFDNVEEMPGGHTVVADDGSFSSPPLAKDQSWSHSFDVPGVYGVHIKEHPNAKASIVVE